MFLSKGYRPELDGLRALAVLAVLFYHARVPGLPGGYVGVDVFFVISGYLITRAILLKTEVGTFAFGSFYLRRFRRLFPAVAATALLTLLAGVFILTPQDLSDLAVSAIAAIVSVANIYFFTEAGYFADVSWTKPLLHTWSLSVEEQFYLIWPGLLLGLTALLRPRSVKAGLAGRDVSAAGNEAEPSVRTPEQGLILWVVLALVGLISFIACEWWMGRDLDAPFFLTPFRVYEFAIGALCVRFYDRSSVAAPALRTAMFYVGIGMVLAAVFTFTHDTRFPGRAALLPCIGTALIICGTGGRLGLMLFANRVARWVGIKSYSIYLAHWPIVTYWLYLNGGEISLTAAFGIIIVSLVLGSLLYDLIETPFRDTRKSTDPVPYPRAKISATIALPIAAIALAGTIYAQDGWTWRLNDKARAIAQNDAATENGGSGCLDGLCAMGDQTAKTMPVLIVGDSHAHHLYTYMDELLSELGHRGILISDGNCAMFTHHVRAEQLAGDDCEERQVAFDRLLGRYPGTPVILAQDWPNYTTMLDDAGDPVDIGTTQELRDYTVDQLPQLQDRIGDRKLVLIGTVPGTSHIGGLMPCLLRPDLIGRLLGVTSRPPECGTDNASTLPQRQETNIPLSEVARDNANIDFLDPFASLCEGLDCTAMSENGIFYSDNSHLTYYGARAVLGPNKSRLATIFNTAPISDNPPLSERWGGNDYWIAQANAELVKDGEILLVRFPDDGRISAEFPLPRASRDPIKVRVQLDFALDNPSQGDFILIIQRECEHNVVEGNRFVLPMSETQHSFDKTLAMDGPAECIRVRLWAQGGSAEGQVTNFDLLVTEN